MFLLVEGLGSMLMKMQHLPKAIKQGMPVPKVSKSVYVISLYLLIQEKSLAMYKENQGSSL